MKSIRNAALSALAAVGALPVLAHAEPVPPDMTTLTGAIDVSTVVTAVLSVGGVVIGVYLAVMGYKIIASLIRGA